MRNQGSRSARTSSARARHKAPDAEQQAVVDPVVEEEIDASLRAEERFDGECADDHE